MKWGYKNSVEPWRQVKLRAVASFDVVIDLVASGTIESYEWKPGYCTDLQGLSRAVFNLSVPEFVSDAFFNSEFGYRGRYAVSPAIGEAANRRLIDSLSPRLLDFAAHLGAPNMRSVALSLAGRESKAWIDEEEEQVARELISGPSAIDYAPWALSGGTTGLVAPVGTRIQVKGSWLNALDNEVIDPAKRFRSRDIHLKGYT